MSDGRNEDVGSSAEVFIVSSRRRQEGSQDMPEVIKDGFEQGSVSLTAKFGKEKRGPRKQTPAGHSVKGGLEAAFVIDS